MRKIKLESGTWLWQVGKSVVVIKKEQQNAKILVPKGKIGRVMQVQCKCYHCDACDNNELVSKWAVEPADIKMYIEDNLVKK